MVILPQKHLQNLNCIRLPDSFHDRNLVRFHHLFLWKTLLIFPRVWNIGWRCGFETSRVYYKSRAQSSFSWNDSTQRKQ
jgi:hypothetical protein